MVRAIPYEAPATGELEASAQRRLHSTHPDQLLSYATIALLGSDERASSRRSIIYILRKHHLLGWRVRQPEESNSEEAGRLATVYLMFHPHEDR